MQRLCRARQLLPIDLQRWAGHEPRCASGCELQSVARALLAARQVHQPSREVSIELGSDGVEIVFDDRVWTCSVQERGHR